MEINVQFTLVFSDATSRRIKFTDVEQSATAEVKDKIMDLNYAMPPAFASTFVSNDGASCIKITNASIIQIEEEVIYNVNS